MVKKTRAVLAAYVDTGAFISLLDRSDSYHVLFRHLFSNPPQLITSALVIAEGHGWFLKRYDRQRAMQFLAMIEDLTPLTVIAMGAAEITGATQMIRKFSDQDLTLADAAGLYLMAQHKPGVCWSTDFHLGITGVPLVINQ